MKKMGKKGLLFPERNGIIIAQFGCSTQAIVRRGKRCNFRMDNLNELMNHIARFLKELLDKFLSVLGFIDTTKNELDKAADVKESAAGNTAG